MGPPTGAVSVMDLLMVACALMVRMLASMDETVVGRVFRKGHARDQRRGCRDCN
jgi:hypothetical protein